MTKKDKILLTALDLFIENGFQGTTMKLIIETSEISSGGVYHHFSNINEIIIALYFSLREDFKLFIRERITHSNNARSFFREYWVALIDWHIDEPKKSQLLSILTHSTYTKNLDLSYKKRMELLINDSKFISEPIMKFREDNEIINMDLAYILYDINSAVEAVSRYLNAYPEKYNNDFIEATFRKYWRSIVD